MKLIFATHNPNKVKEVRALLPEGIELISLADLDYHEEIPETGKILMENALIKADHVFGKFQQNCFAEDTGLEVDALGGVPGVHTARYAGEAASPEDNMTLLLKNLEGAANRKARFRAVFALILDGQEHLFEGISEGVITTEKHGEDGFGYDPVFQPEGYDITFAEMSREEKNKISHRGKALQQMLEFLKSRA